MRLDIVKEISRAHGDFLFFHDRYTLIYFSFKSKEGPLRFIPKRFLKVYFRNYLNLYKSISGFYFTFNKIGPVDLVINRFSSDSLLFIIRGYKVYRALSFLDVLGFKGNNKLLLIKILQNVVISLSKLINSSVISLIKILKNRCL